MSLEKRGIQRRINSLNQHHSNVLKKIEKMKSKSNTAGSLLAADINKGSEVMTVLFVLFKQAIEETNEDKRYFLEKLSDMNKISEALSDYLKALNEITIDVNNANKNDKKYSEATLVSNTIKKLDKMIGAVNSCSSILSSSREERKSEAKQLLRKLNTNVIQIKKKLQVKVPSDNIPKKLPRKKLQPSKKF